MPASQLYRHGMYWTATGSGTIGGTPYTDGDIVYVIGDPNAPYLSEEECTFAVWDSDTTGFSAGTGFYMDASGRFSLGDKLTFDGAGNLSITGALVAATGSFSGTVTATSGSFTGGVTATSFTLRDGAADVARLYTSDTSYDRLRLDPLDGALTNYWDIGWKLVDPLLGYSQFFIKPNLPVNPSTAQLQDGLGLYIEDRSSGRNASLNAGTGGGEVFVSSSNTAYMNDGGTNEVRVSNSGVSLTGGVTANSGGISSVSPVRVNYNGISVPEFSVNGYTTNGFGQYSSSGPCVLYGGGWRTIWYDGYVRNSVPVHAPDGTAAAPAYTFNADTNSGWYSGGNGIVRLSINGVDKIGQDSSGLFCPTVYSSETAGGFDVRVANANGLLQAIVSARRYKRNITPLSLDEAKALLSFEAVKYQSAASGDADDGDRWYIGQIAEQVDEHDSRYVLRDEDGEVQSIDYSRQVAGLIMLVKDLCARVEVLEAQVAA